MRPVVLIYIDGDSYGGDALTFAGEGMPYVVTFDSGRYDKYNADASSDPVGDYADTVTELREMGATEAAEQMEEWARAAGEYLDKYFDRAE